VQETFTHFVRSDYPDCYADSSSVSGRNDRLCLRNRVEEEET
jgi:hypothetical protein